MNPCNNNFHIHADTYKRMWGYIPIVHFFGNCNKLPPACVQVISDLNSMIKLNISNL